jgi:cell fate (sporulation/competence/biofilm development) regulator YlbF (YheA/YmcA/DUF963 family)
MVTMDTRDTRERILEKAEELGRLISQTAEYAYLQAANRDLGDDREATELLNRLRDLQETLMDTVGRGEDPPADQRAEYEELQEKIQTTSRYQALISSQANFDKLMEKVHRSIGTGIRKGEESRIILPS